MNLVIGGSGFIGAHLVQELIQRQEKVRVFDRAPFPEDSEYQPHEMVLGDILDPGELLAAMDKGATVYHLAGTPQLWARDASIFDKLNRQGTENVLRAARRANIKRLVYTSTESILAFADGNGPITEAVPEPRLKDMPGPYCRSKLLAEQAVFRAIAEGLSAVVVCPTLPLGPGDRNFTPPGKMVADFLQGKIPGYMEGTLNFADVRDIAIWHRLAARHGESKRRYILSGHNLSILDFFRCLSRESGRPCPPLKVPYPIALAWSYVEHGYGLATGKKPQSSIAGVKLGKRSLAFNGSWTWQALGHRPRPMEETIRDTVAWHRHFINQRMQTVR